MILDNEQHRFVIINRAEASPTREPGRAVMVGHAWNADLAQFFLELFPNLLEEGYTFDELFPFVRGDSDHVGFGD